MTTPEARARRFMLAIIAAGCALIFAALVLFFAIGANNDTAVSAQALAQQIQKERIRNIRVNCEAQNVRHDKAVAKTLELLGRPPEPSQPSQTPEQRARARRVILDWVDTLVPDENCDRAVAKQAPSS